MTELIIILLAIIWMCLFIYICYIRVIRNEYKENSSSKVENSVELEKFRNENYEIFLKSELWESIEKIELVSYYPEPHDKEISGDEYV